MIGLLTDKLPYSEWMEQLNQWEYLWIARGHRRIPTTDTYRHSLASILQNESSKAQPERIQETQGS